MPQSDNPNSTSPSPQKSPKLNAGPTKMAMEDPVGYKNHMIAAGRESELEPEDNIRAATAGLWQKLTGGGS